MAEKTPFPGTTLIEHRKQEKNKNATSRKEKEFYIREGVVALNLVKQVCSVNELKD